MSAKLGRNDPCHCGSGKKYKRCHLPLEEKARLAPVPDQAAEPEEPDRESAETGPRLGPDPGRVKHLGDALKLLSRSGLLKRDPQLRRMLGKHETLFKYLEHQQKIDAACVKLEPYDEEFQKFSEDDEAVMRRSEELFGEELFAPLRFTAAEVNQAFQKVGFPPNLGTAEEVQKICLSAIRHLASRDRRGHLVMELLMRMPSYVDQGRLIDAKLVLSVAEATLEDQEETNPFLTRMFLYGIKAWAAEQDKAQKTLLWELGFDANAHSNPDAIESWMAEQAADPVKTARLRQVLDAHPELEGQTAATLEALRGNSIRLLDREDAACLMLQPEETEPWAPFLTEKLQVMLEKYGLPESGVQLSRAQQEEAFSSIYLPAIQEMVKGVFTPERIRKLVADLKVYRRKLFAAGEKTMAFYATGAIQYVESEDDPPLNVFLVNLCARSVHGTGSGTEEEAGEDEPAE